MTIKDKILAVIAAIGAFFSAVFYILFMQAKDERKKTEEDNNHLKEELKALNDKAQLKKELEDVKKENDKKKQDAINDYSGGALSASDILSELKANSQNRIH